MDKHLVSILKPIMSLNETIAKLINDRIDLFITKLAKEYPNVDISVAKEIWENISECVHESSKKETVKEKEPKKSKDAPKRSKTAYIIGDKIEYLYNVHLKAPIKMANIDQVFTLINDLSPKDVTHVLTVLLNRYDLNDDVMVYCCKSCNKTGSTVQDHPMTMKFWTCEDCGEEYCDDCSDGKMNEEKIYCKNCAELEENQEGDFTCSSCRRAKPKSEDYHGCKKCINLICEDCVGDEVVKSCKTCHVVFCKICGPTWIKNSNCAECRRMLRKIRKESKRIKK